MVRTIYLNEPEANMENKGKLVPPVGVQVVTGFAGDLMATLTKTASDSSARMLFLLLTFYFYLLPCALRAPRRVVSCYTKWNS